MRPFTRSCPVNYSLVNLSLAATMLVRQATRRRKKEIGRLGEEDFSHSTPYEYSVGARPLLYTDTPYGVRIREYWEMVPVISSKVPVNEGNPSNPRILINAGRS